MSVTSGIPVICKKIGQFIQCDAAELGVRQVEQLWLQRSADEDANQDIIVRRTAWVLQAGKTAGDDSAFFSLWHDEAETIERVTDLIAVKTEADDGTASIFNCMRARPRWRWSVGLSNFAAANARHGEDECVEFRLRIGDELPLAIASVDARDSQC